MKGRIHSIESFGTLDGPGVRMVVFMQGCPLRCKYCHNPDTWQVQGGEEMSAEEIMERFLKNRPFYSNGGMTVSGGEPLLQLGFLIELFTRAKREGVHTCIDTSGATFHESERLDRLIELTDLVMLDLKHSDSAAHKELTGADNASILAFADFLAERNVPIWIRHVVVPTITDGEEHLLRLGEMIAKIKTARALDVLPYHTMGKEKYRALGMEYPLEGIPALPKDAAEKAKATILRGYRLAKRKNTQGE